MNVECQPHLSISWNFLSLLSLLIFSISFERTELTSQQQKLGPHPHLHGRKLFRVHPTPTNHKSHLHNVENGQGVIFFLLNPILTSTTKAIFTSSNPANVRLRVEFIFEEKCN